MASKPPNINSVPNRDIMQRMNYLWQASVYLQSLNTSGVIPNPVIEKKSELKDNDAPTSASGDNPTTATTLTSRKRKRKRSTKRDSTAAAATTKTRTRTVDGRDLARIYVKTMKAVGQKTTTKMDPGIKRTLCQGCSIVLIPGVSVRVRVRPGNQYGHWMTYACLECGTPRSLPAPRNNDYPREDDDPVKTAPAPAPAPAVASASGVVDPMAILNVDPSALDHNDDDNGSKDNRRRLREGGGDELTLEDSAEEGLEEGDAVEQPEEEGAPRRPLKKRKKKRVITRALPLFARRDAGHVVYKGGEVVDMEGVYCV